MKKGEILELEITNYASGGKGIAKINRDFEDANGKPAEKNYVIFVEGV